MRPSFRLLASLACAALVSACSATQFAYNRLDFFARWELGKYVEMDKAQRSRFDADFRTFWDWHRAQELPRYAEVLRRVAARVDTPPERAELELWSKEYGSLWSTSLGQLTSALCPLGASLSDAQVASLLARADEDLHEYAAKSVDLPDAKLREKAERSLRKSLRTWLGSLTPEQKQIVQEWNAARPWVAAHWLDFRKTWRDTLAEALAQRDAPDFCARLTPLLTATETLWTDEQQQAFAANREQWLQLFERLMPTLQPTQKAHLRDRLRGFAGQLEALTARPDGAPR